MSGYCKTHAGKRGPGSAPLCGGGTTRTSGQVASWADFKLTPKAEQCARCAAKLADYDARFASKAAS